MRFKWLVILYIYYCRQTRMHACNLFSYWLYVKKVEHSPASGWCFPACRPGMRPSHPGSHQFWGYCCLFWPASSLVQRACHPAGWVAMVYSSIVSGLGWGWAVRARTHGHTRMHTCTHADTCAKAIPAYQVCMPGSKMSLSVESNLGPHVLHVCWYTVKTSVIFSCSQK